MQTPNHTPSSPQQFVQPTRRLALKPAEERCLQLFAVHTYLTAEQIRRALGFCTGCGSRARALAAFLVRLGLLEGISRDRPDPHGSLAGAYTLTTAGKRALAQRGLVASGRYRPIEERHRSPYFLDHSLRCADVAISAALLCQQTEGVTLHRLWPERDLKRTPTFVEVAGKRTAVIPDLVIDLDAHGDQVLLSCEVDLASERGPAWRRKLERLVAWAQGPFQHAFASDSLTIAVITPGDAKRAQALRHATEGTLTALGAAHLAQLFLFTDHDPATTPPATFWLAPVCSQPFAEPLVPLIEGWTA